MQTYINKGYHEINYMEWFSSYRLIWM